MTASLLVARPWLPLKGLVKVRQDSTLVSVDVLHSTSTTLVVEWRTRSAGLGVLRFARRARGVDCRNKARSRGFVRDVLLMAIAGCPAGQWPELLRAFGGVDTLLDATSPRQAW